MANTISVEDNSSTLTISTDETTLSITPTSTNLTIDTSNCPINTTAELNVISVVQSDTSITVSISATTVSATTTNTTIDVVSQITSIISECKQGPQGIPGIGSDQDQVIVSSTETTIISCIDPTIAWSINWHVVIESPNDDLSKNAIVSAIYNTGNLNGAPCWSTFAVNGNIIPGQLDVVLDSGLICLRFRNDHTLGVKVTALKFPLNRF